MIPRMEDAMRDARKWTAAPRVGCRATMTRRREVSRGSSPGNLRRPGAPGPAAVTTDLSDSSGSWRRGGGSLKRGGQCGDRDRSTGARLIHHLDRETVLGSVGRVEEEDMVVTRSEHAPQSIAQVLDHHVRAIHLCRAACTHVEHEWG